MINTETAYCCHLNWSLFVCFFVSLFLLSVFVCLCVCFLCLPACFHQFFASMSVTVCLPVFSFHLLYLSIFMFDCISDIVIISLCNSFFILFVSLFLCLYVSQSQICQYLCLSLIYICFSRSIFTRTSVCGTTTFNIMTLSITTFSVMDLFVTLSIKDTA